MYVFASKILFVVVTGFPGCSFRAAPWVSKVALRDRSEPRYLVVEFLLFFACQVLPPALALIAVSGHETARRINKRCIRKDFRLD